MLGKPWFHMKMVMQKELNKKQKTDPKKYPTLKLESERDIAMDFALKVYQKFDKLIKSIILFGSTAKHTNVIGSDIDIIIIVDDASIKFDEKLIFWYREELGKIVQENPYNKDFHINTVKLTTWWNDFARGDPVVINIIRYGEALIDFGGFFTPLKILLEEGKVKPTPESIYTCLNRVPSHITRSRISQVSAIEGCYWAMIDSSQALLMSIGILPPSPEHIIGMLKENFTDKGILNFKYLKNLKNLMDLHKRISHGEIRNLDGREIDTWQQKSEEYFDVVMKLIKDIL